MTQRVLELVMALPPSERAELAERRWESLPDESLDTRLARELAEEVGQRRGKLHRGESPLHEWSEVKAELNAVVEQVNA